MPDDKKPQVFLSYASENLDMVRKVYEGLVKRGLNVWFDKVNLKLGKPWKPQIEKAIANSRYFVICISKAAIIKLSEDKPGFQDNELHFAYNIASTHGPEDFGIIPVRLEDCGRGDFRLTGWQQLDLFKGFDEGLDKLAVDMGGISLSDPKSKDERTGNEKLIDEILARAKAEFYAGRLQQSITLIDSVLVFSPDNSEALFSKADTLSDLGKPEEALKAYDQALNIEPDYALAWNNKGIVFARLGKHKESLEAFEKALNIEPNDEVAWNNKGLALRQLGYNKEAFYAFDQAIKINSDFDSACYNKGALLGKLDKHKKALQAFDQVLKINPDHAEAWYDKGVSLDRLGKKEEALKAIDQATKIKPDYAFAWNSKGVVLGELGKLEDAVEAFDQAIKIKPDYAEAWSNKGFALRQLGKPEEAIEIFYQAIKIKPDDTETLKLIEELKKIIREGKKKRSSRVKKK